jgi:hypothetical protein
MKRATVSRQSFVGLSAQSVREFSELCCDAAEAEGSHVPVKR